MAWWCDENVLRSTVEPRLRRPLPRRCCQGSVNVHRWSARELKVFLNNDVGFAFLSSGVDGSWIGSMLMTNPFTKM
ncbi:hypothetical protein P8452_36689 [Trifolium repens]|nr:hypothetical protein P8452_36689 [Trifolium repens]